MHNNLEIETKWLNLKRNCDYYFSQIMGHPLCPPEHVYFSITNRCNLRCRMCNIPTSSGGEDYELTTEECKNIIDQIVDLKINHLILSGGEPLLREDIFDLIAYAVGKRINMVDVITNGLFIDERKAKELINIGLNHITVSIDGLEEIDDFIRGKGSFKKAIEAIDLINKYKNNYLPTVGINFTIMNCNIDHILPMIDLARSKGCNIIVLQPMITDNTDMQERKKNELWVSKENIPKLEKIIQEVIELKRIVSNFSIHVNEKMLKMITFYFASLPLDKNLKCYESIVRIVIAHTGVLWTCLGTYGNLRENSLKDCWFSVQANKIRQEIKQCQNHCLQSCVHLAELSDIYSDARKFKSLINREDKNKEYLNKLLALMKNYKSILNIFRQNKKDNFEELDSNIMQLSTLITDLK